MDFIESLFGISPDGGDGTLEALWICALLVTLYAFAFRRDIRRLLTRFVGRE